MTREEVIALLEKIQRRMVSEALEGLNDQGVTAVYTRDKAQALKNAINPDAPNP